MMGVRFPPPALFVVVLYIAELDFSSQYVAPDGQGTRTLKGTDGADTFRAEALLNATSEIIAKHTNSDGTINWRGVAGDNDNYHDHWKVTSLS